MKTMIKRFVVYLSAVVMLSAAATSYAMHGGEGEQCGVKGHGFKGAEGGKWGGPAKRFQGMIDKLDLSGEQREQLKTHLDQKKARTETLREALKATHKALREELGSYDSDEGAIKNTVAELKAINAQMLDLKVDNVLAMKKILTPEQFQKMKELRKERRNQKTEKMHGRKK